jgi:hypothetical protein
MIKKIAVVLVSFMTTLASFAPAQALPIVTPKPVIEHVEIQQVQYRDDRRHLRRHDRRYDNRRYDRRDRYSNSRHRDRNHRRSNAGAVIGGLAAGAIIGGAIASQNRGSSSSCAARYRSYRASDNTYQPNSGPRRVCR